MTAGRDALRDTGSQQTGAENPYIDEWGHHIGYCNGCGEEAELGQDCTECEDGEVVPYDDDPDPDGWDR